MKVIYFIWGLPQNIIGFIISLFCKKHKKVICGETINVYETKFNFGVSLGEFIILGDNYLNTITIMHEYGHTKQSRMLGLFYLFVVGLPSVIRNIIDRFSKDNYRSRYLRYYGGYPENWADKLAGLNRNEKFSCKVVGRVDCGVIVEWNGLHYIHYENVNGGYMSLGLYELEIESKEIQWQ